MYHNLEAIAFLLIKKIKYLNEGLDESVLYTYTGINRITIHLFKCRMYITQLLIISFNY